ncbi:hypothetical protein GWK47_012833 [Chionoecetes opilio]|uniref:Tesmin/TSO1-like CXC domain-containing protein n=1 Tax=Chionoecetes opilio TaxID=41210 RepID=A0A8J4XUT5_CHIOP|nr:hypothetical protein GWK47_012833 [Chionoecetes opilio]
MSDIRYRHWISSMGRKSAASVHQLKTLPPTSEAFVENVKRAYFQACIWRSALTGEAPDMDPLENGWVSDDDFGVLMPVTLPPQTEIAPAAVMKLIQCGCSSETPCSTERCGCVAGQMSCSAFCRCRAEIRTCRNRWTLLKQRIEDKMTRMKMKLPPVPKWRYPFCVLGGIRTNRSPGSSGFEVNKRCVQARECLHPAEPKSNRNSFLWDKPVVVQVSAAKCRVRQPSGISLLTGIVAGSRTGPWFAFVLKCFAPFRLFLRWMKGRSSVLP